MNNADSPAMPVFPETETGHSAAFRGLTKRENFAMDAMQGLLVNMGRNGLRNIYEVSAEAVKAADALLAELENNHE